MKLAKYVDGSVWRFPLTGLLAALLSRIFLLQSLDGSSEGKFFAMQSGLLGSSGAALEGQSVLLGKLFRFCYRLWPKVPWAAMLLFWGCGAALMLIGYVLAKAGKERETGKENGSVLFLLWILFVAWFSLFCFAQLNHGTLCCVLSCAGVLWLYHCSHGVRKRFWMCFLSMPFFLLGSLLEFPLCLLCTGLLTAAIAVRIPINERNVERKYTIRFLLAAFGLVLMAGAVHVADARMEQREEQGQGAQEAREQARLARQLRVHGLPDYWKYKELYQSLGIGKEDYEYFRANQDYDYAVLSTEAMRVLLQAEFADGLRSSLRTFARKAVREAAGRWAFSGTVTLILLWLLLYRGGVGRVLRMALLLLLGAAGCYALWKANLLPESSIGPGMGAAACVICLFELALHGCCFVSRKLRILYGICGLLLCLYALRESARSENGFYITRWQTNYAVLAQMRADPEHLYLRRNKILSYENCLDPWKREVSPVAGNAAFLDLSDRPAEDRAWMAERYGIVNPWRDMIENENVLLIDDNIRETVRYLRRHYNRNAEAEEVMQLDDRTVYRMILKNED